jgi:hypothetical protein
MQHKCIVVLVHSFGALNGQDALNQGRHTVTPAATSRCLLASALRAWSTISGVGAAEADSRSTPLLAACGTAPSGEGEELVPAAEAVLKSLSIAALAAAMRARTRAFSCRSASSLTQAGTAVSSVSWVEEDEG